MRKRPIPRAAVPSKARHARDQAGAARDGPRLSAGLGPGLADADPDERPDRTPARAREAVYGSAAREEVRRIMREAKREGINFGWSTKTSLCKVARGRAAAESFGVGAGASLHEARPQGAEARAGRAGTTSAGPIRCRQGSPARVAARITATRDEAPNPEGHSRPERGKAIGAARRTAVAPQGSPRSPDVICQTQTPAQEPASRSSQCHSGSDSRLVAGIGSFSRGVYSG